MNNGASPATFRIVNLCVGTVSRRLSESVSKFRVLSPVLVMMVVNLRFSILAIIGGPETCTESLGTVNAPVTWGMRRLVKIICMATKNMMSRECEGCCFVDLPMGEVRRVGEIFND
jgi:hypothetical protein